MTIFPTTVVEALADTEPGASVYKPWILFIYDWLVLGVFSTYAWCCSTISTSLPFFRDNVSRSHLDIGVGTGYYLSNSSLSADVSVTLLDLNPTSLSVAKARLSRPGVQTIQHDILLPLDPTRKYESISMFFLLHCLPGPPSRKMALFHNLKNNLAPGGVIYGTTILAKGVEHNTFGKILLAVFNAWGIFDNREDSKEELKERLEDCFERVKVKVMGRVMMFECHGSK